VNKVKLLIAVLAVAVAAPAAALAGGSAQAASGAGVEAPPVVLGAQQLPGGKIVLDQIVSNTMTGTFEGTIAGEITAVLRPNTDASFHGVMTFTGKTPCGEGTVKFNVRGKGTVAPPTTFAFDVHFASIAADSTIPGLHAQLDATYVGFDYTYTGTVHCRA
jgi:hypothetical protein